MTETPLTSGGGGRLHFGLNLVLPRVALVITTVMKERTMENQRMPLVTHMLTQLVELE